MRVDPLYQLGLPGALNDITAREQTLSQQLSSGLRVALASDDPTAAAQSVRLGSSITFDDAYTRAATGIGSRLQVADSALGNVVTQITSAITLAVKGSDGTLDSANVQAIGQQLSQLRDQVLALANTAYAGSYLFSGTAADTQPFALDNSTTPATAVYNGDQQTQYTATPRRPRSSQSTSPVPLSSRAQAQTFSPASTASSPTSPAARRPPQRPVTSPPCAPAWQMSPRSALHSMPRSTRCSRPARMRPPTKPI